MPNFANKSRLPPLDGTMLTAITRSGASALADGARSSGKKTTSVSAGSSLISKSSSTNSSVQELRLIKRNSFILQIPVQNSIVPLGGGQLNYTWILVDSDNRIWYSDNTLSTPTSTSTTLQIPANHWTSINGYLYDAVFTGQYWFFYDQSNKRMLRGSQDLSTWSIVTGITLGTYYGTVALGSGSTVYIASYGYLNISKDGGLTWTTKTIPQLFYVDPIYSNGTLFISGSTPGGANGIVLSSTDEFTTYTTTVLDNSSGAILSMDKIGTTLYAMGRINSMGTFVWTSTNNGVSWSRAAISVFADQIKSTGSYFVTNVVSAPSAVRGPSWSTSVTGSWSGPTTTDASTIASYDFVKRSLYYNGASFGYRDHTNNKVFKSSDGKSWSQIVHPVAGKKFVAVFPTTKV